MSFGVVMVALLIFLGLGLIVLSLVMTGVDALNRHHKAATLMFFSGIVLVVGVVLRFAYVAWLAHQRLG